MGKPIQALVPAIEQYERDVEAQPELMKDIYMMCLPMPLYKALSDEAAKRNLSFAQLVAKAFDTILAKE